MMQWEQRSSPVSVLLTPPAPFHLEEALSRAEARQLAVAMAARGLQERLEAANREAAASEAAAAARFRRLQRDVADEQRSRAQSRGRRPRSSPLSGVHAMLMWASSRRRGSPRQQQRKSAADASRPGRRRLSLPLELSTTRRRLRPTGRSLSP